MFALSCCVDDDDGFFPRQSRSGHHSTDGRGGSSRSPFGFPDPFSGFGGGFGDGFGGPGFSSFQTFSTSGGKSPEGLYLLILSSVLVSPYTEQCACISLY